MKVSKFASAEDLEMSSGSNDPHVDPARWPRISSPLSFLRTRAFLIALAMVSLSVFGVEASGKRDCVCNFDAEKDYFPIKLAPNFATKYTLEYFKSYKKITVQGGGEPVVTYAYLCGTTPPAEATANNSIQIPIDSSAVTSTTFLPLVAYLGQRSTLQFAPAVIDNLDECLRKLYDENRLEAGYSITADKGEIAQAVLSRTGEPLDVVLADTFSWYPWSGKPITQIVAENFDAHTKPFLLAQEKELHPLGPVEWVEVIAALYNKEFEASYVVSSIQARYNCIKNLILANPPLQKKKVLWGNFYDADFYFGKCPNYYCQMIIDAGGEIVVVNSTSFSQNEAEALRLVSEADVWIYPDGNFFNTTASNPGAFFSGERIEKFKDFPVFTNKRVFDYLGGFAVDWFDDRLAEPDVLLMDLVQAFYNNTYISDVRKKRFIRNVFTEPEASQAPRDPAACTAVDDPGYSNWLTGPCFTTGAEEFGGLELVQPLCATGTPSSAMTLDGFAVVIVSIIMSSVFVMLF